MTLTLLLSFLANIDLQSSNEITLDTYEAKSQEYIRNTQPLSIEIKGWLNSTVSFIKKEDFILELGSAFGQDANYLESLGYKVERTDAAKSFITILKNQGHEATLLNLLTDELGKDYGLIFANSVLHHFTPQELEAILNKINKSLKPSGILSFCVKQGTGEKLSKEVLGAPRYFCYWMPTDLKKILTENGFELLNLTVLPENNSDRICVIARKVNRGTI